MGRRVVVAEGVAVCGSCGGDLDRDDRTCVLCGAALSEIVLGRMCGCCSMPVESRGEPCAVCGSGPRVAPVMEEEVEALAIERLRSGSASDPHARALLAILERKGAELDRRERALRKMESELSVASARLGGGGVEEWVSRLSQSLVRLRKVLESLVRHFESQENASARKSAELLKSTLALLEEIEGNASGRTAARPARARADG